MDREHLPVDRERLSMNREHLPVDIERLSMDRESLSIAQRDKLDIVEEIGDLFDAPTGSILIHACNCAGNWGAGIAKEFKTLYPKAFEMYKSHCDNHTADSLLGTALVIPPCEVAERCSQHYIGCLFTSKFTGRQKSPRSQILAATDASMRELLAIIETYNDMTGVYMCKINSGLFRVPWRETKEVLEGLELDFPLSSYEVRVVYPQAVKRIRVYKPKGPKAKALE